MKTKFSFIILDKEDMMADPCQLSPHSDDRQTDGGGAAVLFVCVVVDM